MVTHLVFPPPGEDQIKAAVTAATAPLLDSFRTWVEEQKRDFRAHLEQLERTAEADFAKLKKDLTTVSRKHDRVCGTSDLIPALTNSSI